MRAPNECWVVTIACGWRRPWMRLALSGADGWRPFRLEHSTSGTSGACARLQAAFDRPSSRIITLNNPGTCCRIQRGSRCCCVGERHGPGYSQSEDADGQCGKLAGHSQFGTFRWLAQTQVNTRLIIIAGNKDRIRSCAHRRSRAGFGNFKRGNFSVISLPPVTPKPQTYHSRLG